MRKKIIYLILWLIACAIQPSMVYASFAYEKEFVRLHDHAMTYAFFQDDLGFVWGCSDNFLLRYDGSQMNSISIEDGVKDIYYANRKSDFEYYLAPHQGLGIFNQKTYDYRAIPSCASLNIRFIERIEKNILMLSTSTGLYLYNEESEDISSLYEEFFPCFQIVKPDASHYYISMRSGVCIYDKDKKEFSWLSIPELEKTQVLALVYDKKKEFLWIGAENGLYQYSFQTKKTKQIHSLNGQSVKCLLLASDDSLWIGTENGVYLFPYGNENQLEHFMNTAINSYSLVNNVVLNLYEDKDSNIWIGTDCGVSVYNKNSLFKTYNWSQIMKTEENNNLICLLRDSKNNYWLGGINGLGKYNDESKSSIWYRAGNYRHILSRNKTRDVYEDRDGILWICTDGSICHFDKQKNIFVQHLIEDSTHTRNANWAYRILEDLNGNLWISSYANGIFVANKQKLLQSDSSDIYLAEKHYELLGAKTLAMDKNGNIWTVLRNRLIKIISGSNKILDVPYTNEDTSPLISVIYCDKDGYVWCGINGGVIRLDSQTHTYEYWTDEALRNKAPERIFDTDHYLCLVAHGVLCLLDKYTRTWNEYALNVAVNCAFYDFETKEIVLGGNGKLVTFALPDIQSDRVKPKLLFSDFRVEGERITIGKEYGGYVILPFDPNYMKEIELPYDKNSFDIDICMNSVNPLYGGGLKYRLQGFEQEWKSIFSFPITLSYDNLQDGVYFLEFQTDDEKLIIEKELRMVVLPPWYKTLLAKVFFVLLILSFIYGIGRIVQMKQRIKIQQIEKEKSLELSRMKMEFLTNISHELKTPLSLILGPVSELISTTRTPKTRERMQIVYENTLKLNSLVHVLLNSGNSETEDQLSKSTLEWTEFIKSICSNFRGKLEKKNIELRIKTEEQPLFSKVDVIKMESVISNLISNAIKFSREDSAFIEVVLKKVDDKICLEVIDNGIGIEEEDRNKVFDRFFRSRKGAAYCKEGSGIGLNLSKKYVEQHGGTISCESKEGVGSIFRVVIPIENAEKSWNQTDKLEKVHVGESSQNLVLLVEDNESISNYIQECLNEYRFIVAHNGESGLAMAVKFRPGIIISDVMMPIMDGLKMAEMLKNNSVTSDIPILLLTAKDDLLTEEKSIHIGVDAFIGKPFEVKLLRAKVMQLIKKNEGEVNEGSEKGSTESLSYDEEFIRTITKIIEDNLDNSDLNVQLLSDLSGISNKQIYRKLKTLTGHTVVDYIRTIRLQKAAWLLSQQKFTVSEVMYMVGFTNASYFSKCFLEMYNKTPKQYANSCK